MPIEIRILRRGDEGVLARVAAGVFDFGVNGELVAEFLADSRHHLAVAVEDGVVVGMASGVHYVHPDKAPQMFINEVGVGEAFRNRGIGKRLLKALMERAEELGCTEAWVLTDRDNHAAMRLYASMGGEEFPRDQVMFTFHFPPGGLPSEDARGGNAG